MRSRNMRGVVLAAALVACGAGMVAAQTTIDQCGELVAGVECPLFETEDGSRFVLSDRENFDVGDRVRVIARKRGQRVKGDIRFY